MKSEKATSNERGGHGRQRALFVTANLPVPIRGGSSQRTKLLIDALSKYVDVDLAPIGPPGVRRLLEENGYRVAFVIPPVGVGTLRSIAGLIFPATQRFGIHCASARLLQDAWNSGRYAIVIGRYLAPSARAGIHRLSRTIVDIDDLDSQKFQSWANGHPLCKWLRLPIEFLSKRMAVAEAKIVAQLSSVWVSADEDARGFESTHVDLVPNIPFSVPNLVKASAQDGYVLFVASLDYRVNVNALTRFIGWVWPQVRRSNPQLKLRVVGGGLPCEKIASLGAAPGVELVGFVDDLEEEYNSAMFTVVPIWEGGGTKIKVLESLVHGRTCVVAAPSMRGYGETLEHGISVLIAQNEEDFVEEMNRLIANIDLRHSLETTGLRQVRMFYGRRVLAARIKSSLETVLGMKL